MTEDEVKQGLENTEQEIKDVLSGAENYVESILPESIQGKKCTKDTDCSMISYCDGKFDLIYLIQRIQFLSAQLDLFSSFNLLTNFESLIKVSKFQNESLKASFLPKYELKNDDFIDSF